LLTGSSLLAASALTALAPASSASAREATGTAPAQASQYKLGEVPANATSQAAADHRTGLAESSATALFRGQAAEGCTHRRYRPDGSILLRRSEWYGRADQYTNGLILDQGPIALSVISLFTVPGAMRTHAGRLVCDVRLDLRACGKCLHTLSAMQCFRNR